MIMKGRLIVFTAGPRKIEGVLLLAASPPPLPSPTICPFFGNRHQKAAGISAAHAAGYWASFNFCFPLSGKEFKFSYADEEAKCSRKVISAPVHFDKYSLRRLWRPGDKTLSGEQRGAVGGEPQMWASPSWLFRSSAKWQQAAVGCACLPCT